MNRLFLNWFMSKVEKTVQGFHRNSEAALWRKLKGAQWSEPLKSGVPIIRFVWNVWDLLVAREQKLGVRDHRALLEHSPDQDSCFYPNVWNRAAISSLSVEEVHSLKDSAAHQSSKFWGAETYTPWSVFFCYAKIPFFQEIRITRSTFK